MKKATGIVILVLILVALFLVSSSIKQGNDLKDASDEQDERIEDIKDEAEDDERDEGDEDGHDEDDDEQDSSDGDGEMNASGEIVITSAGGVVTQTGGVEVASFDATASAFEFIGYGVGKEHAGMFDDYTASMTLTDGKITGGEFEIAVESVSTGIEGLDNHLVAPDFFDAATHPTISFSINEIVYANDVDALVLADLTFKGVTNTLEIPATVDGKAFNVDYLLNTVPFGMQATGIQDEVAIKISIVLQ